MPRASLSHPQKNLTQSITASRHVPPLVHMTHSRCRDPTSLPQRRVHWIAQFRVNKGGASDASDPSPGPWFPHSLAIPSAPCFILYQKESWDHAWGKGWSFTPYCHVPPHPYKTYTSIGPQRGTVWDHTQHKNYANITWRSYTGPLYNFRFFGHNF